MPGYFGDAVQGMCNLCTCDMLGTDPDRWANFYIYIYIYFAVPRQKYSLKKCYEPAVNSCKHCFIYKYLLLR